MVGWHHKKLHMYIKLSFFPFYSRNKNWEAKKKEAAKNNSRIELYNLWTEIQIESAFKLKLPHCEADYGLVVANWQLFYAKVEIWYSRILDQKTINVVTCICLIVRYKTRYHNMLSTSQDTTCSHFFFVYGSLRRKN